MLSNNNKGDNNNDYESRLSYNNNSDIDDEYLTIYNGHIYQSEMLSNNNEDNNTYEFWLSSNISGDTDEESFDSPSNIPTYQDY